MTGQLDNWLGKMYYAEVIRPSDDAVRRRFAHALQASQDLRAAARQRLQELPEALTAKDFIARKHRDFLTAALAEETKA